MEEHRRRPARGGDTGQGETQQVTSIGGQERDAVVDHRVGEDLVGDPELLEDAKDLVIALHRPRQVEDLRVALKDDHRHPAKCGKASQGRTDGTEPHNDEVHHLLGGLRHVRHDPC